MGARRAAPRRDRDDDVQPGAGDPSRATSSARSHPAASRTSACCGSTRASSSSPTATRRSASRSGSRRSAACARERGSRRREARAVRVRARRRPSPTSSTQLARDDGAKVIAGGQSLVPLMAMRLARPTLLVDVNDLAARRGRGRRRRRCAIGATVRHRRLERDPVSRRAAPLLAEAAALDRVSRDPHARHDRRQPRARRSARRAPGGARRDAAGRSSRAGPRVSATIAAADLFDGFLTTTLAPDELIVEVRLPAAVTARTAPRSASGRRERATSRWPASRWPSSATPTVAAPRRAARRSASTPCRSTAPSRSPRAVGATAPDDALAASGRASACARRAGGDADRAELVGLLAARARARARSAGPPAGAEAAA